MMRESRDVGSRRTLASVLPLLSSLPHHHRNEEGLRWCLLSLPSSFSLSDMMIDRLDNDSKNSPVTCSWESRASEREIFLFLPSLPIVCHWRPVMRILSAYLFPCLHLFQTDIRRRSLLFLFPSRVSKHRTRVTLVEIFLFPFSLRTADGRRPFSPPLRVEDT